MQAVETTDYEYEVKNLLLTQPQDWYIEEKTLDAVKQSEEQLTTFYKLQGKKVYPIYR